MTFDQDANLFITSMNKVKNESLRSLSDSVDELRNLTDYCESDRKKRERIAIGARYRDML